MPRPAIRSLFAMILAAALAIPEAAAGPGERIATLAGIGRAINRCWTPPPGAAGAEVTVRFGLTGKGALRGLPQVTYAKVLGTPEMRRKVRDSAVRAVEDCTPLRLSETLGPALANRVLTVRFVQKAEREMAI